MGITSCTGILNSPQRQTFWEEMYVYRNNIFACKALGKGRWKRLSIAFCDTTYAFHYLLFFLISSLPPPLITSFPTLCEYSHLRLAKLVYECISMFLRGTITTDLKFTVQQSNNCQPWLWRWVLQRTWHNQICRNNLSCSQTAPDFPLEISHLVCDWCRRLTFLWLHQTEHVASRGLHWLWQLQHFQLFSFLLWNRHRQIACQVDKLV